MALPTSGKISIGDIKNEFESSSNKLSDYYRGGGIINDTASNSSVPTSGPIKLSDFYGLEFIKYMIGPTGTVIYLGNTVGDTFTHDGTTYTVVDNVTINNYDIDVDDFSKLCTSLMTSMKNLFLNDDNFNQDISKWDTSNVEDMGSLFNGCNTFNQDIGDWDVSKVTDMEGMFRSTPFNQDIGGWDVSKVTDMSRMFSGNDAFNQDIGNWDTSSAVDMHSMFRSADNFNQDIGAWDVSNVLDMEQMLRYTDNFNQDLSGWCVEQISSEPLNFIQGSNMEFETSLQPKWGDPC